MLYWPFDKKNGPSFQIKKQSGSPWMNIDTISPVVWWFILILHVQPHYLLSYKEQINAEKRIKRYLHHKLYPSQNACLSLVPSWKAFNLFPSCSGTCSCRQGAQERKQAHVNSFIPVGPYLSSIFMMKMSDQQVEVDDIWSEALRWWRMQALRLVHFNIHTCKNHRLLRSQALVERQYVAPGSQQ